MTLNPQFPVHDPDKRRKTVPERWKAEAEKAKAINQVTDEIGSDPGNTAGGLTIKPNTGKVVIGS